MQWKYGDYSFEDNNVYAAWRQEPMMSDSGVQIGYREVVDLFGRMSGDTQAELTTGITALREALSQNGKNLVLLENAGSNSAINIISGNSLGGVQVKNIAMPDLKDAQYATYVDFTVTFEAEFLTTSLQYDTFEDSLTVTGNGGPRRVVLEGAYQTIEQITRQQTAVTAVQFGTATVIGGRPFNFPPMLFPGLLQNPEDSRTVSVGRTNGKVMYTLRWSYQYLSADPMSGIPVLR